MEIVFTFLILISVGALIGGMTNSLAIKMLFRPYKALYIGKWRVPFTPGLIPKRRDELAVQLGKMVVDHLLTAEGIQKKLYDSTFKKEMVTLAKTEIERLLFKDESLNEFLSGSLGIKNGQARLESLITAWIENHYEKLREELKTKKIGEIVPRELHEKIEKGIPLASAYIAEKGIDYFESQEGKAKLRELIDKFLEERGTLGNIINMFLGNESLVNKVQPEVIKFLRQPAAKNLLEQLIEKEWDKLKEKALYEFDDKINHGRILSTIQEFALKRVALFSLFEKPLNQLFAPYKTVLLDHWIPKGVDLAGHYLAERIEPLMKQLHLADVVEKQVQGFAVERLEEMVLSISRREFKMITYLGALLGGLIGIIQGILFLFL
ncbi:DUF445 domain-containing protein [Bacillus taeanensis]|uniref:DUF445 domain-containing protein n=1 Tax=Bacillus taeanensis TaxID=273032 RepID=A0A366XUU5_9BACI|nr:DUF445 family protein [Bacillus taeanensis]RBW69348.1 DUF445 domain-containing protein [Bacillus taeanensis]